MMDTKTNKTLVARWESQSGNWWVNLDERVAVNGDIFFTYDAPKACGMLGMISNRRDAESYMLTLIDDGLFQPDSIKTPMKRIQIVNGGY